MAFNTAISGLNAAQNMLATTGNNIANSNTIGFKQTRSEFSDMYALNLGRAGNTTPGSGAAIATDSQQFSQGGVQNTNNPLDLMIQGNGFFVVSDTANLADSRSYTRAGAFQLDDQGFVVNSAGNALLGYSANDPTDIAAGFNTGALNPLQVPSTTADPKATTKVSLSLNLNSSSPTIVNEGATAFDANNAATYSYKRSSQVYDSLGNAHQINTYYANRGSGNWDVYTQVDGADAATTPNLSFDATGQLTGVPEINLTIPATAGSAESSVALDLTGTTQFNSATTPKSESQDGHPPGQLTGINVNSDGVLFASYSNRATVALGQVALAQFQNPQGMTKLGDTRWGESPDSGQPLFGQANTGSFGRMQSNALEQANVDMASELVKLIQAQQMYQANSQAISTENTVVQSILNIR